jgi:hypothetical protein
VEQFANEVTANLDGAINDSVTSLTVKSVVGTAPSSGNFRALVDTELMEVTGVSGLVWTVVRGDGGSTAAAHSDNAVVYLVVTKEALDSIVTVQSGGSEVSSRRVLNFTGATVTDDSGDGRVNITIPPAASFEAAWTVPVLTDYTWQNQGTATANDDGKGIFILAPAAGQNNLRSLEIATGSPPWTYVCKLVPFMLESGNANCGLYLRDSVGGKCLAFRLINSTLDSVLFSSNTSYNSSGPFSAVTVDPSSRLSWFKVVDDNTNRTYFISSDGVNWIQFCQQSRTSSLTADHVGFYAEAGGSIPLGVKLASAKLN